MVTKGEIKRGWPKISRDTVLFTAGLMGALHETLASTERPSLLILFAGMMGLPAILRADEHRQRGRNDRSNDEDEP